MVVKWKISQENLGKGLYRIVSAYKPQSLPRTDTGAVPTAYTSLPVDTSEEFQVYCPFGTGICTASTANTFPWEKGDLHLRVLSLRTVTKHTSKRTAFEEDHAADTRAILITVSFDIDNEGRIVHLLNPEPAAKVSGHKTKFIDVVQVSIHLNSISKD